MEECPETSRTNPIKAIRLKCIDCMAGSKAEVARCISTECPLYPFRFGKNPFRTRRQLTEEEKNRLREQLARGRKSKEVLQDK